MTYCRPEKYNVLIDASIVTETRGRDSSKKANHKPQYRKEEKGKGGEGSCASSEGVSEGLREHSSGTREWRAVYEVEPSRLTRVREKEGVEEKDGRLG